MIDVDLQCLFHPFPILPAGLTTLKYIESRMTWWQPNILVPEAKQRWPQRAANFNRFKFFQVLVSVSLRSESVSVNVQLFLSQNIWESRLMKRNFGNEGSTQMCSVSIPWMAETRHNRQMQKSLGNRGIDSKMVRLCGFLLSTNSHNVPFDLLTTFKLNRPGSAQAGYRSSFW